MWFPGSIAAVHHQGRGFESHFHSCGFCISQGSVSLYGPVQGGHCAAWDGLQSQSDPGQDKRLKDGWMCWITAAIMPAFNAIPQYLSLDIFYPWLHVVCRPSECDSEGLCQQLPDVPATGWNGTTRKRPVRLWRVTQSAVRPSAWVRLPKVWCWGCCGRRKASRMAGIRALLWPRAH